MSNTEYVQFATTMKKSLLLIAALFISTSTQAQVGITVEPFAGLSFPTDSDFGDAFETGLTLGARAGYAITDAVKATVGFSYGRYSSKDSFVDVESAAAKSAGLSGVQGFDPSATYTLFGIRGGVRYGAAVNETVGWFGGVEVGPTNQKIKSDFGSTDGEWDLTLGVYAGAQYYFTPTASVGFGPSFSVIFAEESYHFLDVVVLVAFDL